MRKWTAVLAGLLVLVVGMGQRKPPPPTYLPLVVKGEVAALPQAPKAPGNGYFLVQIDWRGGNDLQAVYVGRYQDESVFWSQNVGDANADTAHYPAGRTFLVPVRAGERLGLRYHAAALGQQHLTEEDAQTGEAAWIFEFGDERGGAVVTVAWMPQQSGGSR